MPLLNDMEREALLLSLGVALRSVLWSLPPAIAVAWLLTRRRVPGRLLLDAAVHLPLVLPPVVVGYLLLLLFGVRGPVGALARPRSASGWSSRTAGAALATAVMSFPLMVRAIRLALEGVDRGSRMPRARSARARSTASSRSRCR